MESTTAFAGTVPAHYDRYLGPLLFEPYALDVVERLQNDTLKQVLELACGTGRVAKHLVSLLTADGQFYATDLNADMLAIAKTRVDDPRVQWQVVDAQELPFENESFDHVICQFGLMFFPDKQKAFHEAWRVLQTGGKYLFSVWDDVIYNPRSFIIRKVMEEMFKDDTPDFFKKGPYSFFDRDEIKNMLREAGFQNIKIEEVKKSAAYTSADDIIFGFVEGSPLSSYMQDKPQPMQQQLRQRLRHELIAHEQQYGKQVPLQALVIEAVK